MDLYKIEGGKLTLVPPADVIRAGLKETADLESWVRDAARIFDRSRVLWISRQERTSADERADLVGISNDELLLVELKRGTVGKEAVSQALSYLSRVSKRDRHQLLDLFIEQAGRKGQWALYTEPIGSAEAEKRFTEHEPTEGGVNQFQTIILVGTDFDPDTLQVCGFLNDNLGESTLTIECWQLHVFENGAGYLCSFDKLLPSRDVEAEIEERREERRAYSHKRDPNKKLLMKTFKRFMGKLEIPVIGRQGRIYECEIQIGDGPASSYYIGGGVDCPELWIPDEVKELQREVLSDFDSREDEHQEVEYKVIDIPIEDWADADKRIQHIRAAARLILKLIGRDPVEVDAIDSEK